MEATKLSLETLMHSLDDQILMAYADGQLDPIKNAEVETAIANDPGAQETVQLFQDTRHLLSQLYEAPIHQPVPERLLATLTNTAHITPLHRSTSRFRPSAVSWSLAATVAVCAIGLSTGIFSNFSPLEPQAGAPKLADVYLDQALEHQASGTPLVLEGEGVSREITPLLTFQDHAQRFCREFENRLTQPFADSNITVGTACRSNEGWQVQVVMNQELLYQESSATDYQPANGDPGLSPYDMMLDRMMSSLPTTPAEEAELIQAGWQSPTP